MDAILAVLKKRIHSASSLALDTGGRPTHRGLVDSHRFRSCSHHLRFSSTDSTPRHISRKSLGRIALIGLFDTIRLLTYSVGTTKALTNMVATIASSYSLIPVFLGIIVLRERLVRVQGVSIVAILVGLGILAIGTS